MSEKEFKNNRPKSNEKDLEGLVQNFSQKLEPAAKKVKKTVGKIERQGMHAAEHYTGDDYTMRGAMVLATCGMAVNNAIEKHIRIENSVKNVINDAKELKFQDDVWQMTKIDEAFNFEHPVFEREFDFIRSRDPEADAALDFLDMEMGRER